ncbi:MAG: hypothetical protein U0W40_00325 [Acidimicrobiia bacterium]
MLVIGLDGFELTFADELVREGRLPTIAGFRATAADVPLRPGRDHLTGLSWELFWSGHSSETSGRGSAVEFDPQHYTAWQEGARFPTGFPLAADTVVFDVPYADLRLSPGVRGVVAWGSHDPGIDALLARPETVGRRLVRRFGRYPAAEWVYGRPWASPADTERMGRDLAHAVDVRADAAAWLLTEALPDWELAMVVVSEPHSAAEGLWHGVDPDHPLHHTASAAPAREALVRIYEAVDRLVGSLVARVTATGGAPDGVVLCTLTGMGSNVADVPAMMLLPELLSRWSGRERLHVPAEWAAAPTSVPFGTPAEVKWSSAWVDGATTGPPPPARPAVWRAARRALPAPVVARVRDVRARRAVEARLRGGGPVGYQSLEWEPATWYADAWPTMRAFALPAFYDGRIRVNLEGREANGQVAIADYDATLAEIEALVRACRDPRTGEGVVAEVIRGTDGDPLALHPSDADLTIVFARSVNALEHPEHGCIGPVPCLRTGGHTGPAGFAWFAGPAFAPGRRAEALAVDLPPTLSELVTGGVPTGMAGESLLPHLLQGTEVST